MAICSRNNRIQKMTRPHQYFSVGEVFEYTPVTDNGITMILEPFPAGVNKGKCGRFCALSKICCQHGNTVDGMYFTPACASYDREDDQYVFFKLV